MKPWQHTQSVQLSITADDPKGQMSPPEYVLNVSVVGDVVFLQLMKYEESAKATTLTPVDQDMAVDARALLAALWGSLPIRHLVMAGPESGES